MVDVLSDDSLDQTTVEWFRNEIERWRGGKVVLHVWPRGALSLKAARMPDQHLVNAFLSALTGRPYSREWRMVSPESTRRELFHAVTHHAFYGGRIIEDGAAAITMVDLFLDFFCPPTRCYSSTSSGADFVSRFAGRIFGRGEEFDQGLIAVDPFRIGLLWFIDRP